MSVSSGSVPLNRIAILFCALATAIYPLDVSLGQEENPGGIEPYLVPDSVGDLADPDSGRINLDVKDKDLSEIPSISASSVSILD